MKLLIVFVVIFVITKAYTNEEADQELRMSFETPHTKWVNPISWLTSSEKPPRVMFIARDIIDRGYPVFREMVEIMQRFEIVADAQYYLVTSDAYGEAWMKPESRLFNLITNSSLQHDVYFFYGIDPLKLPNSTLYNSVLSQISSGKAGAVLIASNDQNLTRTPFLGTTTPNDPSASLYSFGSGRVAVLPAPAMVIEWTLGWEIGYDHWQERLGRTLLWAMNKLPSVSISLSTVGDAAASGTSLNAVLSSSPQSSGITKLVFLERRNDGMFSRQSSSDVSGSTGLSFAGPTAPKLVLAGDYFGDVIAFDSNDRVVTWKSIPFSVKINLTISLNMSQTWGEIGSTMSGTVFVSNAQLGTDERISIQFRDRRWRMISNFISDTGTKGNFPFSMTVQGWFPMSIQIRAVLVRSGLEIIDSISYFSVTKRRQGEWVFLSW